MADVGDIDPSHKRQTSRTPPGPVPGRPRCSPGGVVSRAELARDAFDRDRDRDVDLALAGFVVARVTDRMLDREPSRVAARVRALLGATALTATAPGAP